MGGRVAVIGAGGFVGARLLEMSVLAGGTDVVPVVRAYRSVARSAHLGVPHRLGDASRPGSLERALSGCDAVVNLTTGAPSEILRTTENIYASAVAAGARVLVHMSSATVYGQVAQPDLPDDAPPILAHWMPYARQKGLAENFLRERSGEGRIAIVVLRPGLVWGPGSPWVLGPAMELLAGTAYLVGDGGGVCNLMYVDDLVRNIRAATGHTVPGFYNVGDEATMTWRDYYGALASGLGVDMATLHRVADDRYHARLRDQLEAVKSTSAYTWLKDRLSLEMRTAMKLRLARASARRGAAAIADRRPMVTRTMWHLQTTRHRLPTQKFRAAFGAQRATSFDSAVAASLAWLRFIGLDERDLASALGLAA
jgi:nucleoside-diphosphate-sugar epimerase